jgi:hypothetical protein
MFTTPTAGGSGTNSSMSDYYYQNKSDIFSSVTYNTVTRYRLTNDISFNFTNYQAQAIFPICTSPSESSNTSASIYSAANAGARLYEMFYNGTTNALVTGGTGQNLASGLSIDSTPLYFYAGYVYILGGWSYSIGSLSNIVRRFPITATIVSDANLETISMPQPASGTYARIVSMCVDTNGVFYFLDYGRSVVVAVNYTTNTASIYAGTWNTSGYSGDRGLATSAKINIGAGNPAFITMDDENNLFIADRGNNRIRVVSYATKKIYTIAGKGTANTSSTVVNNTGFDSKQINYTPETVFYHKYTNRLVVGEATTGGRRYVSSIFLGQIVNIVTNPNFTFPSDKTGDQYGPINQTELTTYLLGWNSSAYNTPNVTSIRFINNMNNNNASPSVYDARNITGTTPITTCFYITQAAPCTFDISQNITFPDPRKYFLQFWAAPRTGNGTQSNAPYNYDTQSINLVIDGTVMHTYVFKNQTAFPNGRFELLTTNITTTTENESHTLTIRWVQTGTNDSSIMVTGVEVYYLNMNGF